MQPKTKDRVTYIRTNGERVIGVLEHSSRIHQAAYIRDDKTGKIVAANLREVKKL
jgi:hypothetical protein